MCRQSMYEPSRRVRCRERRCLHCGQCDMPPRFTSQLIPHVIKCMNPTPKFCPMRVNPGIVHVSQSLHPPAIAAPSVVRKADSRAGLTVWCLVG